MVWSSYFSLPALALLFSAVVTPVVAQVHTDCNPLNETCPADPALGTTFTQYFNATPKEGIWNVTNGQLTYDAEKGAVFTVSKKGDSPTVKTNFYFFFGRTEVMLKVAPGAGIISTIVWLSDILDEVDWEFFGSNTTHAETNYFGRGEQDYTNAIYHPMANPIDDYHNYTTVWTADRMDFYIDGALVRTLLPNQAKGGKNYPQTPMKFSLGIWAAGDPDQPEGTREWAQGTTDYSKGPFNMYVKSCLIQDYSSGKEYTYGDHSGTWQSIQVAAGNSTVKDIINKPADKTLAQKWADLPSTTKTGIYAGAAGVVVLAVMGAIFYCFRQRRRGAAEAKVAALRADQERVELEGFRKKGINPDGLPAMAAANTAYRPPGSSGSEWRSGTPLEEKAWDPTTNAASPMPLLRDDPLNPNHATSPLPGAAYSDNAPPRLTTPGPQGTHNPNVFDFSHLDRRV